MDRIRTPTLPENRSGSGSSPVVQSEATERQSTLGLNRCRMCIIPCTEYLALLG